MTNGTNKSMRIIPARAGFTHGWTSATARGWDHPRSRGVYRRLGASRTGIPGSSPLARGLPSGNPRSGGHPGIIPARAGFTRHSTGRRSPPPDHPRSRGVYEYGSGRPARSRGSSPLARGLRGRRRLSLWCAGIIPARAGFTSHRVAYTTAGRDHPRSRGVYSYSRPQQSAQ